LKNFIFCKILFFYIIFTLLNLTNKVFAKAEESNSLDFVIRNWTTETGLSHNTVLSLFQTYDEYIWVGTTSGLLRFDGLNFTAQDLSISPEINKKILSIYEDLNHNLWIGTDGNGLFSYRNGVWAKYNDKGNFVNNHIRSITGDWQGNLWIGTEYGLYRIDQTGIQSYTKEQGLFDNLITALDTDNYGNLWIGTYRGGLAKLKDGIITIYDYNNGLLNVSVNAVKADHLGNIWIGTMDGLYKIRHGEEIVRQVQGTKYAIITSIIEDKNDEIFFSTMTRGIGWIRGGSIIGFSSENGLPDDYIHCALNDGDGNIWLGTNSSGLIQLKMPLITNLFCEGGLPDKNLSAILEDKSGSLWVGTKNRGLFKLRNNKIVKTLNLESGLSSNHINVIYQTENNNIWIGTAGNGLNKINTNGSVQKINVGLSSKNITTILEEKNGSLIIGTNQGLNRIRQNRVEILWADQLGDHQIRILTKSENGLLYVGTNKGLYTIQNDKLSKLLPQESKLDVDIISIFEMASGKILIGTNGSGLLQLDNGELKSCTINNGLPDNYIFSITEDFERSIWISSYNGIFKLDQSQLIDFFDGNIPHITPAFYNDLDGMKSRQCLTGSQPTVCKSLSGKLYFLTTNGISMLNPEIFRRKKQSPLMVIESILKNNLPVNRDEPIPFSDSDDKIEIHYTAFDYTSPEKIHFKYQLVGHDPDFIFTKPGLKRVAEYTNLNPGQYRFVVTAASNNGYWDDQVVATKFEIHYPYYKTTYFYLIVTVLIIFLGIGLVYLNSKMKTKKSLDKYKTSTLDPELAQKTIPKLINLMETEQLYLDPELSLKDLSQKLNIHYNHLSRIINEQFGASYNDYINKYRIDEAKRRLADQKLKDKTVLEIMYDTGFYSKSVFNVAFKKFTGKTPSEFRKNQY